MMRKEQYRYVENCKANFSIILFLVPVMREIKTVPVSIHHKFILLHIHDTSQHGLVCLLTLTVFREAVSVTTFHPITHNLERERVSGRAGFARACAGCV